MVYFWECDMNMRTVEIGAALPPVSVAGMTLLGFPLADWVQLLALVWLVIQIGHFVYTKYIKKDNKQ